MGALGMTDEGLIVSRYASFPSLALPVSGSLIVLFRQLVPPNSHKTVAISRRVLNGFPRIENYICIGMK